MRDYLLRKYYEMLSREVPRQRSKEQEKRNKKYRKLMEKAHQEKDWGMYCYYRDRIR